MRRLITWLVLCLLAWGCAVAPTEPWESVADYDAEAFEPPSWYPTVWGYMEVCTGRSGIYADLRWFRLRDPHTTAYVTPRGEASGTYLPLERAVVFTWLASTDQYRVQHEMLHALGFPHGPMFDRCEETNFGRPNR